MAARPKPSQSLTTQVTLLGHNSQIVPLVGFFVGGEIGVLVVTASGEIEEHVACYPGVQVRRVSADYAACPPDLPPPPYIVCVDQAELANRIRAWLPASVATFLASNDLRRRPPGFLQLMPTPGEHRRSVLERLTTLKRVDDLSARVRAARAPLILMYGDPDPDAIGAALGLATLWQRAGADPTIRFTGEVRRYQNKLLLGWLKQPIAQVTREELDDCDLLAVVDCQPAFWKNDRPRAQVVIDHHPRHPETVGEYLDIREDYGSTSTILTEYLTVSDTPIDRKLATALLYGLQSDTDDLQRHAGPADIRAYDLLLARADRNFLARLHKSQVPLDLLDYVAWGITHRVHYDDVFIVHFGSVPTPDVLVQTADLLLLTCGINWVVCAGVHEDRLVAVFRGDGHHQDVGQRAALAFAKLGSAGGHRTMGRAEVPLKGEHVDTTVELLVDNLFRRMSPRRRATLVRRLRNHLHGAGPADPAAAALEGG